MSNAYVSALWGADYLLTCANAGFARVNLHGGGWFLHSGSHWTESLDRNTSLVLWNAICESISGFDMYDCKIDQASNLATYFGKRGKQSLLALINKDQKDIVVDLPDPLRQQQGKN